VDLQVEAVDGWGRGEETTIAPGDRVGLEAGSPGTPDKGGDLLSAPPYLVLKACHEHSAEPY